MAVLSVKKDWKGLGANFSKEDASAPVKYTVLFDNADDPICRPILAKKAVDPVDGTVRIPPLWSRHPSPDAPYLFVSNIAPDAIGPFFYEVRVTYSTLPVIGGDRQPNPGASPLDQPWKIRWGFVSQNEQIDRDINGKPLHNSAGELFDPPLQRDKKDLALWVQRPMAWNVFSAIEANSYIDAINTDWFLSIFAPGLVLCVDYGGEAAYAADLVYWMVNYEFHMREDGWKYRVEDAGYRYWNKIKHKYEPIVHLPFKAGTSEIKIGTVAYDEADKSKGIRVAMPWPLNTDGDALNEDYLHNPDNPLHWCEFDVLKQLPFSVLGF